MPYVSIETIDSARAKEILESAKNVRKVNNDRVAFLADQMIRGLWDVNLETVKFDTDGLLVDGQHRLLAVVQSGAPITTAVGYNVASARNVDVGNARGPHTLLTAMGYPASTHLAFAAKLTHNWARGLRDWELMSARVSRDDLAAAVGKWGTVLADTVRVCSAQTAVPRSKLAFVVFEGARALGLNPALIGTEEDRSPAQPFIDTMSGKRPPRPNADPAEALRRAAVRRQSGRGGGGRWQPFEQLVAIARAWNRYCAGLPLNAVQLGKGNKIVFPEFQTRVREPR